MMPDGSFLFPKKKESSVFFYDNVDISGVQAKITIVGNTRFFIGYTDTEDTNIVWEELTGNKLTGTQHDFANTGKYIYWKGIGESGSKFTRIQIKAVI